MTAKLLEGETIFRALLDAAPDAMVIVGADGVIIHVNAQTERLFGHSREALLGQHVERLLPERFGDLHKRHRDNYFSQPRVRSMGSGLELNGLHAQGHEFPVEVSLSPLQTAGGLLASASIRDVTERKTAEQARDEAAGKVRELAAALAQRAAELEELNRELEAFSYSVSHDLRSPLRALNGFSQALLTDYEDAPLDERGRDYLQRIRRASEKMGRLIDDLLELSRLSRITMQRRPVDLSAIARDIIAELRAASPERSVDAAIEEGLEVEGDARLIEIMLRNLLGNAWKFTSKHPRAQIEVGLHEANGNAVYYVRDDGAGFDMAYAGQLFAPFQRLHSDHDFGGTGIGLAIVQRIVGRHGGRIWVEAEVDRGATFFFTFRPGSEHG
ncbi:MAG: PAS domain S-box protein [Gammaproteobacteria bacterium]|nr:PAS domain S-box protein [Gammaproteobacteria bacterium]